ncbi:MAG TPA: NAD(P)/FAD-dependent oxidoreductase [Vicinamibacterales bacterium]|nr:NAD(P)/FAD-dependent oxidoreductase [Vicinamibacterales bacterium]
MKVIVVGGGPAGLRAALRARELGASVTLIEAERLGGICFNKGPAPVRTLARAARLRHDARDFPAFGLRGSVPHVDIRAVIANATRVAAHANEDLHLTERVRDAGVEVIDRAGRAHFIDRHSLALQDGRRLQGDRVVLAVGGFARKLPIPGHELALSFDDLWSLGALPSRAAVVGGSATGCQLASILADFGVEVTLLEGAGRLIPRSDVDISRGLEAAFIDRGMRVVTAARSTSIDAKDGHLRLAYEKDGRAQALDADAVFLAVGWPGNIDSLRLEAAGVETRGSYIRTDEFLRTSVPDIFAAGDVNGLSMLVQSAALQGIIAAENAVRGAHRTYRPHIVATGSFTQPECASVGLTEEEASADHKYIAEIVRYEHLPRAIIDQRTDGLCKLIVDRRTGTVLGAHVLGSYSAEIIQVAATCMAAGMDVRQIADLELAFPTFTEAIGIAARQAVRTLGLEPKEWPGNFEEMPALVPRRAKM